MARPLRIEFPDAWYHLMNRARRSEKVFHGQQDYQSFVELFEESSEMWNIRVAAYCLMTKHYHILVQTPNTNISKGMRHIDAVYTQRFNKRHRCDGQPFRGRYKLILVGGDNHILQLVRYIHCNPVIAGIVSKSDDYRWSSHKGYLSIAEKNGPGFTRECFFQCSRKTKRTGQNNI
ncbi:MAG: transposase [Thermodesulfobacteriota bacterium]|nr:transposase [Thermodesulfobacteriota bacterium]